MWRNCAHRAQVLSRRSAKELSSRSEVVGVLAASVEHLPGCSESLSASTTVSRSFSSRKDSLQGNDGRNSRSSSDRGRSQMTGGHAFVTLIEARQGVAALRHRLSQLGSLPPVWETTKVDDVKDERKAIFQEAQSLVGVLHSAVRNRQLNPAGKHGNELVHLLGQVLVVYAQTSTPHGDPPAFDACCNAMTLLQQWNLDVQPLHFACAVEAAARESRWKEAADMFWIQIDPDASGHTPMEISRHLAVGLYAIARNSQNEGGTTPDHVMDAVLRMAMVCPMDQDKYVLAAGVALGHAGEGESFMTYLKSSYNSSRLGQPLVAAVMHACVLSSVADKALVLFEELVSDPTVGEWQYGGVYDGLNPVCRDLAMTALGASSRENVGELALDLYQQVKKEGLQVSVDALCGVVKACERDGKWREAVEVLMDFLHHCHDPRWLVDSDDTAMIVRLDEALKSNDAPHPIDILSRALPQVGDMLASVMRSCNAAGNFAVALLCCRLVDDTLPSSLSAFDITTALPTRNRNELVLSTAQTIFRFKGPEPLLVVAMTSLSGLGCNHYAKQLYAVAIDIARKGSQVHEWPDAFECHRFVQSSMSGSGATLPSPWESAYKHICRISAACARIQSSKQKTTHTQRKILTSGLCKAMRACTAANQPEAGILLAKRLEGILTPDDNKGAVSLGSAMSSFLFGLFDSQSDGDDSLFAEVTILAETINAYRAMNMPDEALDLLTMIPESFGSGTDDGQWTPVINAAIRLLSDMNRVDQARALFEEMDESSQNHETLLAMATGLEKDKEWREIIKLFFRALESGLLSEQLGVLAMKGVVESRSEGQMHNLRLIVRGVCALSGRTEKQWLESHYWHLERALGWDVARMLMWWGDPVTGNEMKLQFAIEQFDARQKAGLTPKNDILRFIVLSAREYREPTELMPFSREEWLGLLRGFLIETETSTLLSSPKFVESGCKSLLWLGGNKECVEFVSSAVARGVRITNETVIEATRAAQEANLEADELSMLNHVGT